MKFSLITLILIFSVLLSSISVTSGKMLVACSIPDFVPIVEEIGGNAVKVVSIMPPGCDPHAFTISEKTMNLLEKAKLIVLADSKLISFERKIKETFPKKCIDFNDYKGVKLDNFSSYKPCYHGYWLKLENGIAIAKAVKKALCKLDPKDKDYFESNLELFEKQVREAERVINEMSNVKGKYCIAAVPGVCYIAENSGMKIGAVLMDESAGFVSGGELVRLEKEMTKKDYVCIIVPKFAKNSKVGKIASQLAEDSGKPVVYVKFVMADKNDTYVGIAYYNAMALNSERVELKNTPGFEVVPTVLILFGVSLWKKRS